MTYLVNAGSTALALSGNGMAVNGITRAFDGEIFEGMTQTATGMGMMELGGRLNGISPMVVREMEAGCLSVGLAASSVLGVIQGVRGDGWKQKTTGVLKALVAGLSLYGLTFLDARTSAIFHQTLTIGGSAYHSVRSGIELLKQGKKTAGMALISLGCSAALFAYLRHQTLSGPSSTAVPADVSAFVENHPQDIEALLTQKEDAYFHRRYPPGFEELGRGRAKITLTHEDLPSYAIKVSKLYNTLELPLHHKRAQEAAEIAKHYGYQHLLIPKSYLVEIPNYGTLVFDQKVPELSSPGSLNEAKTKAISELNHFLAVTDTCDVNVNQAINAGFIPGTSTIAVIDFDCPGPSGIVNPVQSVIKKINVATGFSLIAMKIMNNASLDFLGVAMASLLIAAAGKYDKENSQILVTLVVISTIALCFAYRQIQTQPQPS